MRKDLSWIKGIIWGAVFLLLTLQLAIFFNLDVVDDSLISARYAYNLLHYGELSFNHGNRVEGYTSFLWVIGPAILSLLSIPPDTGVFLFSVIACAAGGVLVAWIVTSRFQKNFTLGLIAGLSLVILLPWIAWGTSGMESCGFATLWLLSLYLYSSGSTRSAVFAGLSTGLSVMTRPDGLLLIPVIFIGSISQKKLSTSFPYFLLGFAALFGSYFSFRLLYFGDLFPNTYYAKVDRFSMALVSRGVSYFWSFVSKTFPLFITAALAVRFWKDEFCRLLIFGTATYILFGIVAVGGDHFALYRFCVPILPVLIVLSFANVKAKSLSIGSFFILILSICCSFLMLPEKREYVAHLNDVRNWRFIGLHLGKVLPKEASVATIPIGAIGYYSKLEILDMYGIVDKQIARKPITTGHGLAGHEKFDNDYILSRRPDVILIDLLLHQKPGRLMLWGEAAPDMVRRPVFKTEYRYVPHLTERGYLHLFIRKDRLSKRTLTISGEL